MSTEPLLALSVFGKHPAWDDHMDDIGEQSRDMQEFKRIIYVEGIGRNIDSGTWAQLSVDQRLPEFNHLLVYSRDSHYFWATLSASTDGKGRSLYPLVVALQSRGFSPAEVERQICPLLLELRDSLQNTDSADEVRTKVSATQQKIQTIAAKQLTPVNTKVNHSMTGDQVAMLFANEEPVAASRIFYATQRAIDAISHDPADAPTESLRLPLNDQQKWFSARMWCSLIHSMLGATYPVSAIEYWSPKDKTDNRNDFVDLIIGEPKPAALFCLRAGLARMPLVSDIPFELNPQFLQQVRDYLTVCRSAGDKPAPSFLS
ncbi:MAG TPA: hypothetical protein VMG59_05005 [Phycisphaerae bacterium]|nr:hypothetical protein [Phycisphaerae bacterium]